MNKPNGPEFSESGSEAPPIGPGFGGIESVSLTSNQALDLDQSLEQMAVAFGFRARYGIITPEQYDAGMSFLEMLEDANGSRVARDVGGVMIDDNREPALALINRPVFEGSDKRLYYLVARPDVSEDSDLFKSIHRDVNKDREWKEMAIALADTLDAPRNRSPIIFPVEDDYDDQMHGAMLSEAEQAHRKNHIDEEQLNTISAVLMYRDIFRREIGSNYIREGEDGNYWRVYEFPRDEEKEQESE